MEKVVRAHKQTTCTHCFTAIAIGEDYVRVNSIVKNHIGCYRKFAPIPWSAEQLKNNPWLLEAQGGEEANRA